MIDKVIIDGKEVQLNADLFEVSPAAFDSRPFNS